MTRYYHYEGLTPEKLEHIVCPVCGADRSERVGIDNGYSIQRCSTSGCDFVYVNPRPNSQQLAAFYAEYYDQDPGVPEKWQAEMGAIFDECRTWLCAHRAAGEVLDVGCSFGHFLFQMEQHGWRTVGVEPSAVAAAYARSRLRGEVFESVFETVEFEKERFDAVVSLYVLEHLSAPRGFVERVFEILKKDGVAIIRIPYTAPLFPLQKLLGRSLMYAPMHLNDFSPRSMQRLATSIGFRRCEVRVGRRRKAHDWVENFGARVLGGLGSAVESVTRGRAVFPLVGALSYHLYK